MLLKQQENGRYRQTGANKLFNIPDILNVIKTGEDIKILSKEGYDITMEFLIKQCIGNSYFRTNSDGECWLLEFLSREIDEEVFYNVIRSGGLGNYLLRGNR